MKKLANKKNGLFKDGSELIEKKLKQDEELTTDEEIEELFQEMGKKIAGGQVQAAVTIGKDGVIEVAANTLQALGMMEALMCSMENGGMANLRNVREALMKNPYTGMAIMKINEMGKKNGGEGQLGDEEVDPLNFDGFTEEDFRDVADEPGVLN